MLLVYLDFGNHLGVDILRSYIISVFEQVRALDIKLVDGFAIDLHITFPVDRNPRQFPEYIRQDLVLLGYYRRNIICHGIALKFHLVRHDDSFLQFERLFGHFYFHILRERGLFGKNRISEDIGLQDQVVSRPIRQIQSEKPVIVSICKCYRYPFGILHYDHCPGYRLPVRRILHYTPQFHGMGNTEAQYCKHK